MIWNQNHISESANRGEIFFKEYFIAQKLPHDSKNSAFRIAIVGGGPKGLYALDHLLENIRRENATDFIEVIWFNTTSDFGSGPNYQVHQPDYLLINYCIGNIDARHLQYKYNTFRLNLVEWIKKYNTTTEKVSPTDYASRALVGRYLQDAAMRVIQNAPKNVKVFLVTGKVTDIEYHDKFNLWIDNRKFSFQLENILLATGHCYSNPILSQDALPKPQDNYIPNAYPVTNLNKIPGGSTVGIIGMGLTFIDVALQLTEGKGGYWHADGAYQPSGNEPVLYPFSRSNFPIIPRAPAYGSSGYKLYYLDEAWFLKMKEVRSKRKIDFTREVYPLLQKEITFAYYSTLWQTRDKNKIERRLENIGKPERFTLEKLLFPKVNPKENHHEHMLDYLKYQIAEAEKGEQHSPVMTAAAVWRETTPMIGELYKNGGFTGSSQEFLDKKCFGSFCRVSFGPPIANMKKILALAKMGIISFRFEEEVKISNQNQQFLVQSTHASQSVDYLIDARIARPSLSYQNSDFYNRLSKRNIITSFLNQDYQPGCLHINENGQVVTPGKNIPLYCYGSNTEGILLDNDSLSRHKNDLGSVWAQQVLKQINHSKPSYV
ncbi:FAD/NAD(P)-binding protein [Galbibacter sp.]|uniref:FAD/NAD(P)-binding protein n=1 Tax=Galbibacter sp. TaxID=2918471 RepID=UPI003A952BD8